jgi:hypothetical protein
MPITINSAIEDVAYDRVDKSRSAWIDQLDYMVRGSDPLYNVYCRRLMQVRDNIALEFFDTPQIVVFNSGAQGAMLGIVVDLFVTVLPMYRFKSLQTLAGADGHRHIIIFELRDNNDAWIVEEMKRMYKDKIKQALVDNEEIGD